MPVKTATFGNTQVPQLGFGAMGLSAFYGATDVVSAAATLKRVISEGCSLIDTADMYGNGANELLIGQVLKEVKRDSVFVVTKFGHKWEEGVPGWTIDCSKEYAAKAIDASIQRLGSPPDAWAAHRIDKNVPVEETVAAMEAARVAGKCKYIGLSECSAATLRRAVKVAPIHFIEVEYSAWETVMERNGVIATAKELGIAVLAYSPLGRGFLTGRFKTPADFVNDADFRGMLPRMQAEVWEQNYRIVTQFEKLATAKNITPSQLALAWLMHQGDHIIPIPGTKSEKYFLENWASLQVTLSTAELAEIRQVLEANAPVGDRYYAGGMEALDE